MIIYPILRTTVLKPSFEHSTAANLGFGVRAVAISENEIV